MRIKEFEVKNYKSLENVVLKDLGDFNVLIGKNSSGKTNILEAMNMYAFRLPYSPMSAP